MSDTDNTTTEKVFTEEQLEDLLLVWANGFKAGVASTLMNAGGVPREEADHYAHHLAAKVRQDEATRAVLLKQIPEGLNGRESEPAEVKITLGHKD